MEEHTGWRGALETAWGNLTGINDEGNIRIIRMLFFLVLLLGTAWAVWNYRQGLQFINLEALSASSVPNMAELDKKRLGAMIEQVELTSRQRAGSQAAVRTLEKNMARYPFTEPKMGTENPLPSAEENQASDSSSVVVADYPPEITLRGIMIMDKQNVAVVDISGAGTGIIVRAGYTFMQKRGRVVRVAPDKVVVNWGGKDWDVVPSF